MATSSTQNPDLDWSHVGETVRMLNLAVAQIEMSMKEGDDSVDTLTDAFTTMAARVKVIENLAKQKQDDDSKQVVEQCDAVAGEMQQTIMAFQFYDKVTQRLNHVSHSLAALVDLVGDQSRLHNPIEWSVLQEKIKSKYTMPAEHDMFEKVMQGMSIEEVIEQLRHNNHIDDIELF